MHPSPDHGRSTDPTLPALRPEIAARVDMLTRAADGPEAERARAAYGRPFGPVEQWDLDVEDTTAPGPHGPVPVRVYRPAAAPDSPAPDDGRPCLVWVHGGAFAWGDLDMAEADLVARGVAGRAGAVVVSVGYRLCDHPVDGSAPANPGGESGVHAPVPVDDVEAALEWTVREATRLGADPARIAVGGASAGGCLAQGAALRRARAGAPPWQTLLLYPALHRVLPAPTPPEERALAAVPAPFAFTAESWARIGASYIGTEREADEEDYPGLASEAELAILPPTYVEVDELDDLRTSGRAFAEQLARAGVDVEFTVRRGVPHGHLSYVGLDAAAESMEAMARRLTR